MGQEIVYCARCNTRLMSSDLEAGRGRRVGNRYACAECAPAMLKELTPEEREAAAPPPPPSSRRVRARESTRRARAPASRGLPVPAIVGIVVAIVVLIVLAVALSGPGGTKPAVEPKPDSPEPSATAPPADPPPKDAVTEKDAERFRKARETLDRALAERDPERRLEALRKAVFETAMTPHYAEARAAYEKQRKDSGAPAVPPPPEPPPPPPERPWRTLFDGTSIDFLNSTSHRAWKLEEGALVPALEKRDAAQSAEQISDGEVRVRFEHDGGEYFYFAVRQGGGGKWRVTLNRTDLQKLGAGPHVLHFICSGETVTATADGKNVEVVPEGGKSRSGRMQFLGRGGTLRILSVEVRPLSE